jgi:phosphoketolase
MSQNSSRADLESIDALWRAANYLSVGQIYLYDNPLLKLPLERPTWPMIVFISPKGWTGPKEVDGTFRAHQRQHDIEQD